MDIPHEEFSHNPTLISILSHSFAVFFAAPKHFLTIAAALVLPLSSAILIHTLLAHPFIHHYLNKNPNPSLEAIAPFAVLQSIYLLALFALSLLSTAAVVYSAACLYTAKGLNFKTLISAIPRLLRPLFLTFVWASLIMFVYYFVFMICVVIAVVLFLRETDDDVRVVFAIFLISIVFGCLHVYISAVWHLASVIAVLEEGNCGLAAMKKSRELMKGKVKLAWLLVFVYLLCNAIIGMIFNGVVVRDKEEYGLVVRIFVGILLVAVLMFVNLVGLLVQSVFYYACKAYQHQGIDKSALYEHLGGYLGEYVPLKSSIQMENL